MDIVTSITAADHDAYPGNRRALDEGRITRAQYDSMAAHKFNCHCNYEDLDIEEDYSDYGIEKVTPHIDGEEAGFWLWLRNGQTTDEAFEDDDECQGQNITGYHIVLDY